MVEILALLSEPEELEKRGGGAGGGVLFRWTLMSGVIDEIFLGEDQLGVGRKRLALLSQLFQDVGQSLGGVKGCVIEQDDRPGTHFAYHSLLDVEG